MKCKGCGKVILNNYLELKNNKYHNEICLLKSMKKDKTSFMKNIFYNFMNKENKKNEVKKFYFINFQRLINEMKDEDYIIFYLYNIKPYIKEINKSNYIKDCYRQREVWKFIKNNVYVFLPLYYNKLKEYEDIFKYGVREYLPKRRKNKLLEE